MNKTDTQVEAEINFEINRCKDSYLRVNNLKYDGFHTAGIEMLLRDVTKTSANGEFIRKGLIGYLKETITKWVNLVSKDTHNSLREKEHWHNIKELKDIVSALYELENDIYGFPSEEEKKLIFKRRKLPEKKELTFEQWIITDEHSKVINWNKLNFFKVM